MTSPDYTTFRALSFDIYGTLIDYESSLISLFTHHTRGGTASHSLTSASILKIFRTHERTLQSTFPINPYRDIANEAARLTDFDLSKISGQERSSDISVDIAKWPAFPDTVDAMKRLGKHYKLIALSNIDHASFFSTLSGPLKDVQFDAMYISEDIGTYKPSQQNFKYLIEHAEKDFGVKKEEVCMVAHGLETDHVPLKEAGLKPGVWIMRGEEGKEKEVEGVEIGGKFETLKEFADAVEKAWEEKGKGGSGGAAGGQTLEELEDKGIGGS